LWNNLMNDPAGTDKPASSLAHRADAPRRAPGWNKTAALQSRRRPLGAGLAALTGVAAQATCLPAARQAPTPARRRTPKRPICRLKPARLASNRRSTRHSNMRIPAANEVLAGQPKFEKLKRRHSPFPVAVKPESSDLPHKTEAGAVRLQYHISRP